VRDDEILAADRHRQRPRILRNEVGRIDLRMAADGNQDIAIDRHVQHFLHDVFGTVNELFHHEDNLPLWGALPQNSSTRYWDRNPPYVNRNNTW